MIITWIEKKELVKKLPVMLLFIMLGAFAFIMFLSETSFGQVILKRAAMVSISAIETDSSLSWRSYETKKAIKSIREAPIIGHGTGYKYHNIAQFGGSIYYIHNNYLFIWMKMGILGLAAFIALLANMLRASINIYNIYQDDHIISGCAIATFAYICGIIPALAVAPVLANNTTVIILLSVLYGIFIKLNTLDNVSDKL